MRTIGISGKLTATLWGACSIQLVALLANVIATGEFDRAAVAQIVSLALTAVGGAFFGYRAAPDTVAYDPGVNVPAGGAPPDEYRPPVT